METESREKASPATRDGSDRTGVCEVCQSTSAHRYNIVSFSPHRQEREYSLCVRCARDRRRQQSERSPESSEDGWTRQELIAELNRFFAASGALDICRRCHQQGTGCCPPTCRVMGPAGCNPNSHYGKTVFCATFICSALVNAIFECDPETGRELKRIKNNYGPAEFHIYEMITRVPAQSREPLRPLALPERYPQLSGLDGEKIRIKLQELADEVLQIRREWHKQE